MHYRKWLAVAFMLLSATFVVPERASAISFALDSIAEWGKFPRFCVNTYRWGDKFFNSYDSTYVIGSGKRMNVKTKIETWSDIYDFRFRDVEGYRMAMVSRPSTTLGFYVTYMAVSVGYDMNVGKYFNGDDNARKRFNFQFNCSLFAAEFYTLSNDIGTRIHRMGPPDNFHVVDLPFSGINNHQWGLDVYYFFNHKHYSQGAAFHYSKIQLKSSGTLFAGLSFSGQKYEFDFQDIMSGQYPNMLPSSWGGNYGVTNKDFGVRMGYAYNWVPLPGWCVGTSVSVIPGLRKGNINEPGVTSSAFALSGNARLSLVYNLKKKWFFGAVARTDARLVYDSEHTMIPATWSVEASAGFRFDLWFYK